VPKLSSGDYSAAFGQFLTLVRAFYAQAQSGPAYSADNPYHAYNSLLLAGSIGLGVGLIAAGITVTVWKRQLKTARPATEALSYQVPGSLRYTAQTDQLVDSRTAVVPIPRESSRGFSGGGGGGFGGGGGSSGFGGKF